MGAATVSNLSRSGRESHGTIASPKRSARTAGYALPSAALSRNVVNAGSLVTSYGSANPIVHGVKTASPVDPTSEARPDRIPALARLTAHRKSACRALRRLDGPTTHVRYQSRGLRSKRTDTTDDQSRQCHLPQRLHTPPPTSPQVSRLESPADTVAWTRTSRRIPGGPGATRSGLRVCAAHRPATQSSGDRQNDTVSIPPLGIRRGPPNCVSAGQRPSQARGGR
jgi:hypothetical protein